MENTSQSGPSSLEDQSVPGKGMHHYVSAYNTQIWSYNASITTWLGCNLLEQGLVIIFCYVTLELLKDDWQSESCHCWQSWRNCHCWESHAADSHAVDRVDGVVAADRVVAVDRVDACFRLLNEDADSLQIRWVNHSNILVTLMNLHEESYAESVGTVVSPVLMNCTVWCVTVNEELSQAWWLWSRKT